MPNLLDLPLEVRLDILRYATLHITKPPEEHETIRYVARNKPATSNILYTSDPFMTYVSLQLVSRQIQQELRLIETSNRPEQYDLDLVMYKMGKRLVTTWTYVPRPSNVVNLYCTIRLHGEFEDNTTNANRLIHVPQKLKWTFYELIKGFCRYGARLRPADPKKPRRAYTHYIKRLVIDVQSHDSLLGPRNRPASIRVNPSSVFEFLIIHMTFLTSCDHLPCANYGELVYMHFGQIEFRVDGNHRVTVDLDARLAFVQNLPHPAVRPTRSPFPYELRTYYTVQMWAPFIKRWRARSGLSSDADDQRTSEDQDLTADDLSYYLSWKTCQHIVKDTRPETR